jgi:hypothetical protein
MLLPYLHKHRMFLAWQTLKRGRVRCLPQRFVRCLHMDSLHPIVSSFASSLVKSKPSFSVPARNLRFLTEPTQFYAHLLVRRARRVDHVR